MRALIRLRLAGRIDGERYRQLKAASYSGLSIGGDTVAILGRDSGGTTYGTKLNGPPKAFVQHLRADVEHRVKAAKLRGSLSLHSEFKAAKEGPIEDLFEGFDEMFTFVTQYIVENWQVILQMIVGLLVFLEEAEGE